MGVSGSGPLPLGPALLLQALPWWQGRSCLLWVAQEGGCPHQCSHRLIEPGQLSGGLNRATRAGNKETSGPCSRYSIDSVKMETYIAPLGLPQLDAWASKIMYVRCLRHSGTQKALG